MKVEKLKYLKLNRALKMKLVVIILINIFLISCKTNSVNDVVINKLVNNKKIFDILLDSQPLALYKITPGLNNDETHEFIKNNKIPEHSKIKLVKLKYNDGNLYEISNITFNIDSYFYEKKILCEPIYGYMIHYKNYKVFYCLSCDIVIFCDKNKKIGGGLFRDEEAEKIRNIFISLSEKKN